MFNIVMRHEVRLVGQGGRRRWLPLLFRRCAWADPSPCDAQVHTQARVTLSLRSGMVDKVARITQASMAKVFAALRLRGAALSAALAAFTPDEHELHRSFRYTANRVPGSQQSMQTLRSSVWAYYDVMQTFTMNLNINPSDLTSHTVFGMASPDAGDSGTTAFTYSHDANGVPDPRRRPTSGDRYKIVAKNSVAAALYFRTVLQAFISVFLGFDPGESVQARPDWCAVLRGGRRHEASVRVVIALN
jgi:hypothetical protein